MRKLLAASLVFATLGSGVTSMALAQDARPAQPAAPAQPAPPGDHGMMMGGGDMSTTMGRMTKMMDACEKMMQSTDRQDRKGRR